MEVLLAACCTLAEAWNPVLGMDEQWNRLSHKSDHEHLSKTTYSTSTCKLPLMSPRLQTQLHKSIWDSKTTKLSYIKFKAQIKTEALKVTYEIAQQTESYQHYTQDSHTSSNTYSKNTKLRIKEQKLSFLFCWRNGESCKSSGPELAIRNGQLQLKALAVIIWVENSSKIPIPTKALKYYFTANKKWKRSRSTAGEQSIAVDAEDWKKLLPLAPWLAYFLPRKRTQKKSDKAMASAPLLICCPGQKHPD